MAEVVETNEVTNGEAGKPAPEEARKTFEALGLAPPLLQAVKQLGFKHPTHTQVEFIPPALAGRDVLGQARTGTGKTAAFGLPMLQLLDAAAPFCGLVLCPTRELAIQVGGDMRQYAKFGDFKIASVYGGQRIRIQAERLQKKPAIVVGTPGRVMDMHRRGLLPYDHVKIAVLDEVDRMLDIGFRDDIRKILGTISGPHQTIFVSATISPEIERLARQYMHEPEKIVVSAATDSLTVAEVQQHYFAVEPWDKKRLLVHLLKHEEPALTLVFCRTKQTVDALTEYIRRKGIDAHAIHGDMYQSKRNQVMTKFRRNELSVLVASDLAARGLDVAAISHVINYDLPEDPENYVHRVGRTARAGKEGVAWAFVTPNEGPLLLAIERLAGVEIDKIDYDDFKPGPVPPEVVAERQRQEQRQEAHRMEHSRILSGPPSPDEAEDATKFPGGLVPTAIPPRRLGGKLRRRRR
jgi:ATP-dependent RNA helicase DeaD